MTESNKKPLVSVVITTFNRSAYLKETIGSIVNQTFKSIEILVIDDGSSTKIASENKAICNLFSKCFYYFKNNTGQPDSRNYGIHRTKGSYIAFCDDDDFWLHDKLEKQLLVFKKYPEVGLVTGNIEYVNTDGIRTGRVIKQTGNHGYVFESFLLKNKTSSITPVLKREVIDKVGLFNPNFVIFEDWEYWRRVAYYYPFYALQDVLACVRKHDSNTSLIVTQKPLEQFVRYRKLTKALLKWGENRFTKADRILITKVEAKRYAQLLRNHCPGFREKIMLFLNILKFDLREGVRFFCIFIKYQLS